MICKNCFEMFNRHTTVSKYLDNFCSVECFVEYEDRICEEMDADISVQCDGCENYCVEGGDWVPYGSTNVRLPELEYCEAAEDDDEQMKLYDLAKLFQCHKFSGKRIA